MPYSTVDNAAFDTKCAAVPTPFGPFTRVGDVPALDPNSNIPHTVTAFTGTKTLHVSYDTLNDPELLAKFIEENFGLDTLIYKLRLMMEVIEAHVVDIDPPLATAAEQQAILRSLCLIPTLFGSLPWKALTEFNQSLKVSASFTATVNPGNAYSYAFDSTIAGQYYWFLWDFGDGETSLVADPTHVYAEDGTYVARLLVIGAGGVVEVRSSVVVNGAAPVAAFAATPETGATPLHVDFTNTTTGATSYEWYIDAEVEPFSTDFEPYYDFVGAATYTVKLIATGPGGTHEITHDVVVTA